MAEEVVPKELVSEVLGSRLCWGCASEAPDGGQLMACARCRTAKYCGADCQRAEWKKSHKKECGALKATREAVDRRLAVRVRPHGDEGGRSLVVRERVARGQEVFSERPLMGKPFPSSEAQDSPESMAELADLLARRGDPPLYAAPNCMGMAREVVQALSESGEPDEARATRLARVMTNCFRTSVTVTVRDAPNAPPRVSEGTHDASLLLPHVSLLNHSCWPSACQHMLPDNTARIVALRDLEPGEELTICYHSSLLWNPREVRRAALQRTWHFDCACARCESAADGADAGAADAAAADGGWPSDAVLTETSGKPWDENALASLSRVPERSRDDAWVAALAQLCDSVPDTNGQGFAARKFLVTHLLGAGKDRDASPHLWRVVAAAAKLLPPLHLTKLKWLNTLRNIDGDTPRFDERLRDADPHAAALEAAYPE